MKNKSRVLVTYITGFILSILLTFFTYSLIQLQIHGAETKLSFNLLVPALLCTALIQLFVQLIFFLHLGTEKRPRWNLLFFIITFLSVLVVIVASMWIMNHLNYNMTPSQMNKYIKDESSY